MSSVPTHFRQSRRKWRQWGVIYLLVAPTIVGTALFAYYPNADVFMKMFYHWEPAGGIDEYIGFENLRRMFSDDRFWASFRLALILLVANGVKMWPSIGAAVLLHRLRSARARYVCQVLFVMPMVIPGLVWLLMWKNYLDPDVGIINRGLAATGAIDVLRFLDHNMWRLADVFHPLHRVLDTLLGSFAAEQSVAIGARTSGTGVWGLLVAGLLCLTLACDWRDYRRRWLPLAVLGAVGAVLAGWKFVGVFLVCALFGRLVRRREGSRTVRWGTPLGWGIVWASVALILLTRIWTSRTGAFDYGNPVWLGYTSLVVPTLVFWGFPWVGTMGVLIYLSGLQGISDEIYEAGELDGLSSWGRFRFIEFPLIMSQVRIMLILMTIGTLNDYGMLLLLLGPEGGPGGTGMVPGLYMYNQAFKQGSYGYACALGVLMFVLILGITMIYQRYVRVEK